MLPKKVLLSMVGSLAAIASTVAVVDDINRQITRNESYRAQLTTGLLGVVAGTALTVWAQSKLKDDENETATADDLTDENIGMVDQNISKVSENSRELPQKTARSRRN